MHYARITLLFLSIVWTQTTLAHGGLDKMSPAELEMIQRMLVREGYLVPSSNFQYGVYAYESEEAFDTWDTERIKKNMQKQLEDMQAEQRERGSEAPAIPPGMQSEPTLLQKVLNFFKKILSLVL